MKRVELERRAIVAAIDDSPNITAAAHKLGAARRTLQSRMRDHGIPPGEAGRPRELLPYHSSSGITTLAGTALVGLGAWWLIKRSDTRVTGDTGRSLHGLNVILARR